MHKRHAAAVAFAAWLAASVHAQGSPSLRLGERIAIAGGGDAVTPCATCHGVPGREAADAAFPSLAGRPRAYLRAQLDAYAEGRREHPIMSPIARAMTAAQREATAAWYAQLEPPAATASPWSPRGPANRP